MHLAGEADAGNVFACEICCRKRFAKCGAGGAPPVFGMLLGPANLRRRERLMVCRGGRNEPPALIDDDRARAACANVNPKYVDKASSTASSQLSGDIIYSQAKMTREGQVSPRPREELQQDLETNSGDQPTWLVIRNSGRISKLAYCGRSRSVLYCSLTLTSFFVAVTVSSGMLS